MKLFVILSSFIALCSSRGISRDPTEELQAIDFNQDLLARNAGSGNAYWLFTRQNPTVPQIIIHGDPNSLSNSNYDPSKPLKVTVHGWTNGGEHLINTMITAAYLETSDVNVIVLDWREAASGSYATASLNVPSTGQALGSFIEWVFSTAGGSWDTLHLIGYSLGAHVVGNAGRAVWARAKRVTGLDPAGPFWSNNQHALNILSGRYVEAIHTNIAARGITEEIALADFYPNGGNTQPGCDDNRCAHARAYEFFASSIRTDHFVGRRCVSLTFALLGQCSGSTFNMGNGDLSKQGFGIYALETGDSWPY